MRSTDSSRAFTSQHLDPNIRKIPSTFATAVIVHGTTHMSHAIKFCSKFVSLIYFISTPRQNQTTKPRIMTHLPKAVPYPERYVPKQKPAIGSEVIHKQLVEVLEHRASASASTEAAESSPTSSYGTAPEQTNAKSAAQSSPSKESKIKNAPSGPTFNSGQSHLTTKPFQFNNIKAKIELINFWRYNLEALPEIYRHRSKIERCYFEM